MSHLPVQWTRYLVKSVGNLATGAFRIIRTFSYWNEAKSGIPYLTNAVGSEEYKPGVVVRTVVDGWLSGPTGAVVDPPSKEAEAEALMEPRSVTVCEWRTNWDGYSGKEIQI